MKKMHKTIFYILITLSLTISCTKNDHSKKNIAFYHWKSKATYNKSYQQAINTTKCNKIYLHYFDIDIDVEQKQSWYNNGAFPTYVLKNVSEEYKNFEIIPVVYITNRVFKTTSLNIPDLSDKIVKLVNQISIAHFDKEIKQIQVDCDWTLKTKNTYFELLKRLQDSFDVDVTIRLHQIKYNNKTGIPPVQKATLMLYNVGDLKNKKQNSTLESSIVKQYINSKTEYPIKLNIALPLFSQTIVSNQDNEVKILKNTERTILENDTHFRKTDNNNFTVVKDTLYKGFFLSKGYNLKLEELKEAEIIKSYKIIRESNLITNEIIFYHLDDNALKNTNLFELIKKL